MIWIMAFKVPGVLSDKNHEKSASPTKMGAYWTFPHCSCSDQNPSRSTTQREGKNNCTAKNVPKAKMTANKNSYIMGLLLHASINWVHWKDVNGWVEWCSSLRSTKLPEPPMKIKSKATVLDLGQIQTQWCWTAVELQVCQHIENVKAYMKL